ncbi:phosphonate metabolism protein/1,5-bisphosphokinase (PRPP-forming) PhnN [Aurantimonas sp. 22II-16-19i]|uniref:phosphonate metabolism protein/1,5-bisphosphokinase (PRPP-forming) PhnN n=1 Tax=Aurantimonas sp. 22II-16-19i TaxID=1317114 RepID=UPI0009F7F5A4|nr:phosphonate metabolism protein/1,5-bisphosphokinase (PRPP-forming) PhnN [Aurantimonas sp. 22II-16-19i]ORE98558.1 phosphonate metabolism protein/1,5-bisphosphokinase (prpp-forming) phnn [Aurantimonas sp. 22II-16-19i]
MSPDRQDRPSPGAFVAVVGPSGAGKDTLIRLAAEHFAGDDSFHFARRFVTRTADPDAEDHAEIDEAEFVRRRDAWDFALCWRAHGLGYGLDVSLLTRISNGQTVIANISRSRIGDAAAVFPRVAVAHVVVDEQLLVDRIVRRGREDRAAAMERARREAPLELPRTIWRVAEIDNSGPVAQGLGRFIAFLEACRPDGQ